MITWDDVQAATNHWMFWPLIGLWASVMMRAGYLIWTDDGRESR